MSRDGLGSIDSGNLQQFATHAPTSLTDYYGLTVISSSLGQCYSLTLGQSCTAPLLVQQLCSMTSSGASLRGVDQTVKDYMKTLCKLRITCRCLGCATPVLGSDLEVPVNAFIDPVDPMRVFVNYWRTDRPEEILHPLFPEPNSGMPGVPRRGLIDCCPCAAAEPGGSLLRTLLHEGLHSHCHESGGTDCGHGGEWHNSDGAYDDAAEDLIECIGGNSSDACKRAAGFIHDDPLM